MVKVWDELISEFDIYHLQKEYLNNKEIFLMISVENVWLMIKN